MYIILSEEKKMRALGGN